VDEIAARLAQLGLFTELSQPQLERLAHDFEEHLFSAGQRILRQGLSGMGLYVILDGEVAVAIDGEERVRLGKGDFFGEVSVLLAQPPTADVVVTSPARCLCIPQPEVRAFLIGYPQVTYRMLQIEARRLASTLRWLA
jgi:CRP-like cAMP-binding protein